jgi:PilZ domain-containing protein
MADDNSRDNERVPVPAPLHGEVQVYQPMTILDISRGGAQIETPFPLQLDLLHDFRLSLGERSIVVKGRIANCHVGELKDGVLLYRTGVEFIEASEHVQSAIAHFVEALKLVRRAAAANAQTPPVIDGQITE